MKKYLLLFIALILISSAYAYPCIRHTFKETGTENPVTNVKWEVWACGNSACTTINPTYWHQSGTSGSLNYADIKFKPTLPPSGQYLVLLFHDNYIYKYVTENPAWSSKTNPDLCDRSPAWENPSVSHFYFNKKANCKAPASLTVENKIGEWLPLTIDTTSQLDASTASAISPATTTYYPPDEIYKKYKEVATAVSLQIKDKATGSVVKTASQNLRIYFGTTKAASFSWTPSEPSYKAGKYTVILTTHVTDPKCSSVIDDVKQQDIEVFPELPDDACVIKADQTKLRTAISRGQQGLLDIPAYYYHMKKEYDANYVMHLVYKGVTANYKLTFTNKTNKVDKILTGSFPKSFTDVRTDVAPAKPTNTVAWT
ncbi:MAG: hypothetical protein HYZ24_11480, partial [Chloroflexi bacterium]|nr:hypothetical protein [Chloroflexota bacterium]